MRPAFKSRSNQIDDPRDRREKDRYSRARVRRWGPFSITVKQHPKHRCVYGPIAPMYAARGGGPILKTQRFKWMYFNGMLVHTRHGHVVFMFRRSLFK